MNVVTIIGRLVNEGEYKVIGSNGTQIYKNTVAVNRRFKKDEADFINILAFSKTSELINNHFTKGDEIALTGRIQTGSYEKEGQKRYTFEVVVDNITFTNGKKNKQQSDNQKYSADPGDPLKNNGEPIDISDDDLPF
jgi:single-strand DNA-binding protein